MNLLPLEVMPGWPEPEPLSPLFNILLMGVAPILTGLIITALVFGPRLARGSRENTPSAEIERIQP